MSPRMATTQWSRVLAARDGSDSEAQTALEELCSTYWEPLYAFARHQGASPDEAADLTQGYFSELFEKRFLDDVEQSKGSFRAFMLASMRHYLSHQRERSQAKKRGGGTTLLSLDVGDAEQRYRIAPSEQQTPERVFEYRWAVTIVHRALDRLRRDSVDAGRGEQFDALKSYLTSWDEQMPYREMAGVLGSSERAVKTAVYRLRMRFGEYLRAEVADTVSDTTKVDDELRQLLSILRS